jgi:hypothetical protein
MANWKQIQARIRKARTGADAIPKMTALYERTRDAMVAFELAKLYENSAARDDAANWYQTSWQRFRRADWKKKAEEALARLGAPLPAAGWPDETAAEKSLAAAAGASFPAEGESPASSFEPDEEESLSSAAEESAPQSPAQVEAAPGAAPGKRTRRGRRGGRRHRRGRRGEAAPAAAQPAAESAPAPPPSRPHREPPRVAKPSIAEEAAPRGRFASRTEEVLAREGRSRTGDPGLTSRKAKLDSQLRRLLNAEVHALSAAESAPAGPGVFLLSDSEMTTHYYIERCDTLRVAIKFLTQGGRSRERGEPLRLRLARYLGINDAQSKRYMQEHCAVRWLQLDEGAAHLAHYAIAVLQPALND